MIDGVGHHIMFDILSCFLHIGLLLAPERKMMSHFWQSRDLISETEVRILEKIAHQITQQRYWEWRLEVDCKTG
jgi:hypothetical protein